ncbi:hypothetical protein AND_000596 [Anopheles darlingi]|uniref:Uncharacterized protein n=1 Tax=Anopheles darlingi TaxID=43151 RepID=W5JWG8_ANODA|nr:hypothetical protein AND_000596 [Anopheles darlingi]
MSVTGGGGLGVAGGSASAVAAAMLKSPQTALQLLLEEINFQRTKEMRQLLKDDGGFVVLQGTTYWTDLFVRHFLFQSEPEHSIDCDDLLFFVRKKHIKGSSRTMPKYETEIEVFRKDSRKLPIGDPDVDWEETVYLNLVIHQFNYTLTLAICTRTSPKELQVLRRHSQKVYASPSRRKMDTKGDSEEITYPHICFMVDNFDEVFHDILVRDGEMVCVELVATDRDGSVQGVIFLGSIRYDALKRVYDARQSSLGSKVAQRMSFGLFSSGGPQTRCEFVRMKGPQGKGHAEMAVTKPKGSGVETPTSEPGFCATDMWDSEWEEDCEEYYNYRHQRRLSDPSANLNNFSRYGWRTKNPAEGSCSSSYGGSKARSENEGLDCLANEVSEIEAGDLRDDRPASSIVVSDTELPVAVGTCGSNVPSSPPKTGPVAGGRSSPQPATDQCTINGTAAATAAAANGATGCCNCFGMRKRCDRKAETDSIQMSDVYTPCPKCQQDTDNGEANGLKRKPIHPPSKAEEIELQRLQSLELHDSPACLATVSKGRSPLMKHRNVLIVESELEFAGGAKVRTGPALNDKAKKKPPCTGTAQQPGVKKRDNSTKTMQSPKKRLSTPIFRTKRFSGDSPAGKSNAPMASETRSKSSSCSNSNQLNNNNPPAHPQGRNGRPASSVIATAVPTEATEATEEYELADDAVSLNDFETGSEVTAKPDMEPVDPKQLIRVNGKEEFPVERNGSGGTNGNERSSVRSSQPKATTVVATQHIKEHRERRTSGGRTVVQSTVRETITSAGTGGGRFSMIYRRSKSSSATSVAATTAVSSGKEKKDDKRKADLARKGKQDQNSAAVVQRVQQASEKNVAQSSDETTSVQHESPQDNSDSPPEQPLQEETNQNIKDPLSTERDINGNPGSEGATPMATTTTTATEETTEENDLSNRAIWAALKDLRAKKECSTLPKMKKPSYNSFYERPSIPGCTTKQQHSQQQQQHHGSPAIATIDTIPMRRTPDGTNIYYLCDYHPKRHQGNKELDDGAYNPLWTTKGFTQTFHFWKENRRQQSTPLNAFLTYVTLPWWSIAKDLLDHREQPILTF